MLAGSTLPVSLLAVAQVLRCCFTAPSYAVFTQLLAGMIVTTGPRTVTGMLTGAGLSQTWSHHRVHRFFSRAAWQPRQVALVLSTAVIETLLPAGAEVRVAMDDTLLRRRGKKVWAALWTHDGSARSKGQDRVRQHVGDPGDPGGSAVLHELVKFSVCGAVVFGLLILFSGSG